MFVSGFTFVRNARLLDYPVQESIRSILPLCDEVVVAVGKSDDDTLDMIRSLSSDKVRILETEWDDSLRTGGRVLAVETMKAFRAIRPETDWALYIQADEVMHEADIPRIRQSMETWLPDKRVDGLLFNYLHFYGSYDYVASSSRWYRHEIRVIRNNPSFYSYRDAQGFRKGQNEKLHVKDCGARMFHYGWVRDPRAMQRKQESFNRLWHDDTWVEKHVIPAESFDYSGIDLLTRFQAAHPGVMQERIRKMNWEFDHDLSRNQISLKEKAKAWCRKWLGLDFSYRNYKLIR